MSNPSFPIVTLTVWAENTDLSIRAQIDAQATAMAGEGKTDGVVEVSRVAAPAISASRNWIDTSAANEWIAFVQSLGGPLDSITIV